METAMWVFETREEIEEADNEEELFAMQLQIQTLYDDKIAEIARRFEASDFEGVKELLEKTKYVE